jgi:hypothetical protein
MKALNGNSNDDVKDVKHKRFTNKRIVFGILLLILILWVFGTIFGLFDKPTKLQITESQHEAKIGTTFEAEVTKKPDHKIPITQAQEEKHVRPADQESEYGVFHKGIAKEPDHKIPIAQASDEKHVRPTDQEPEHAVSHKGIVEEPVAHVSPHGVSTPKRIEHRPRGVAFVEACIKPLDYELNERFWGWRPNDIVNLTDNVNSFQLGVLEVTRRTAVNLAERISRTGSTAAFDVHLEQAMNWFMIKSDRYWFPSAESKYREGLKDMRVYLKKLEEGKAAFYTRADNIIPLLAAYQDLLGGCDENLVKITEDDGSPVSFFQADNYFYYAKGIASAMGTVLEAILEDFSVTLESRHGTEILHHAIESCHWAAELNPWVVTDSSLSGILANHRANMAAPISHARFYLGVLIKTLST